MQGRAMLPGFVWQNEAKRTIAELNSAERSQAEGLHRIRQNEAKRQGYIEFGRTNPRLARDLAAIFIGIEYRF